MTKPSTTATQRSLREVIADDSHALTFQTSGQYRAALLKHEPMEHTHHAEAFAWAVFAKDDNVIIWSKNRAQVESASKEYGRPIVPVIALFAAEQGAAPVLPTHCDPAEGFCAKCREQERAALANQPAPTVPAGRALADAVLRDVCELVYTEDFDHEKMLSVTIDDLHLIVSRSAAALAHQPAQEQAEPVDGDMLPPVGAKVLIHLGRQDAWVEHTVTGYYVWPACKHQVKDGEKDAHRVFVRVKDAQGYDNARLLSEVKIAGQVAQQEPVAAPQQAAAPGALDADEMTRLRRLMAALGHADAFELTDDYVRGILCTLLSQAAGKLEGATIESERAQWTTKQWYEHVGAWETPEGHIAFGSVMALGAMLIQFQRAHRHPAATSAPGTPEAPKKPAHGHRDDYYLLANGRRLGLEPISRVRSMPNWVLAMELFATGSTSAHQLCRDAGVDPDSTTTQRAAQLDCGKGERQ